MTGQNAKPAPDTALARARARIGVSAAGIFLSVYIRVYKDQPKYTVTWRAGQGWKTNERCVCVCVCVRERMNRARVRIHALV